MFLDQKEYKIIAELSKISKTGATHDVAAPVLEIILDDQTVKPTIQPTRQGEDLVDAMAYAILAKQQAEAKLTAVANEHKLALEGEINALEKRAFAEQDWQKKLQLFRKWEDLLWHYDQKYGKQ